MGAPPRTLPFPLSRPVTDKWVRARYVAERREIAARYAEWEITGPPEIREWREDDRYFNPFRVEGSVPDVPALARMTANTATGNVESIMDFVGMVIWPRRRIAIVGVAA